MPPATEMRYNNLLNPDMRDPKVVNCKIVRHVVYYASKLYITRSLHCWALHYSISMIMLEVLFASKEHGIQFTAAKIVYKIGLETAAR